MKPSGSRARTTARPHNPTNTDEVSRMYNATLRFYEREVIVAEAYRAAQKIKGEGDAEAARAYNEAFGKDPQFAQFYRSLEAYKASFSRKSDVMVLDPAGSDFFKTFRSGTEGSRR